MENKSMKVLAIDDNTDNLIIIKALISESFPDAKVIIATSGAEGLQKAAIDEPDVILLDVVMPGMDGFEVCEKLKSNADLSDIPVVFVTALKDDKQSRIKGLEVGGEAFLSKPIDESELTAQMRAMMKIRAANLQRRNENERLSGIISDRTHELEQIHKATLNLLEDIKTENEQRQRTEQELRKSEARLLRAELASKSGNWELNMQENIITVSQGAMTIFGLQNDKLLPQQILDLTLPEYRNTFRRRYRRLVEYNESFSIEVKIRNQISEKILDILCIANYDEQQKRMYGVVQDITEQKQMRQALADSEALYKAILNSTPDIVLTTDVNGKIIMASPTILSTYGYSDYNEVSNKTLLDFLHPDDSERALANFSKMQKGIHTGPHEYKSVKKDGSIFEIEVKGGSIKDKDGNISKLVFIARDITERKRAQAKLIRSEAELRAVWENSASGLRLTDAEGKIIRVNKAYCKIYGKSQNELTGSTIASVYPVKDAERKIQKHKEKFEKRTINPYVEKEILLWNGERKWVQVENSFMEGERPLLLGIFTEITQRKLAEEKVKHLSRLYAFTGQVNQAIVHTPDTDDLMKKICKVATEFGGFRMASIGKYDLQRDKIDIVTWSGYENGYLNMITDVYSNVSKGWGPTAIAINKKQITYSNDMSDDDRLITNAKDALARGYKSFAVIPLLSKSDVYGILTLYASELDFFNEEELMLLTSISEDINFALNAIEAEKTRKEAEISLLESENRYTTFVNNNVDMIFVKDENLRYLVANNAMAEFFHKPIHEIIHKTDSEIAGQDLIIPCESSDQKALKSEKAIITIEKLGDRYFETTKFRMPLKNGKYGIGGILHDITHRLQSEQALEDSRLELKAIYDNTPVMLCVLDEKLKIQFQNIEFSNFTNQFSQATVTRLVGNVLGCISTSGNVDCGTGADCPNCTLRKVIKNTLIKNIGQKSFEHHTTLYINGEEKEFYLLGSTAIIHSGGTRKILLSLYDITSMKEAELELKKSEMFLRTFIDNTPFQIWARDTNNVGILENKMMQENFGSILGKKPSEDPNINKKLAAKWEKQNLEVMQGKFIDEEVEHTIKGEKLHYHQTIFPISVNGKIVAIAGFDIDITERIRAQEQLKSFAAHIQNIREEERVVLAREIHDDLGQILVAIKIDLGMLGKKAKKYIRDEVSDEFMTHFQRLAGQVDNTIKTARRIMSNLRPEVLDILGFEDAVRSHISTFSERFNIACDFHCGISNFKIEQQNSLALFRIIQESLNNVAKHAFATKIDISIEPIENDKVIISISDNGVGFDLNAKRRDDSYGLIGMRERAYLLDAEFDIRSEPGKGTQVTIVFPFVK